jgi:hypothetical protein
MVAEDCSSARPGLGKGVKRLLGIACLAGFGATGQSVERRAGLITVGGWHVPGGGVYGLVQAKR